MEKIHFYSCDQRIDGTLVKPEKMQDQNPGVAFFHGMTSSEKKYIPIAEQLAQQGIVGMTLSIRGHGSSEGDFETLTIHDALADGLAAYDFLARYDFIDKNRIGLCGTSVGAAIVAMVSAQRVVKSLVLRVPAAYTDDMMKMTFRQIMNDEEQIFPKITNISETPALKAMQQFTGSLLVITSEQDHVVPATMTTAYFADAKSTAKKETVQIQGATHDLTDEKWRKQFIDRTIQWFVETL